MLRDEILELEKILSEKKKQLFLSRIETIADAELKSNGISNVEINLDTENELWQISYVHKTDQYCPLDYANNEDKEVVQPDPPETKETLITFGKNKKYFIRGGIQLNVYRNSAGELRILNPDYEFDLDLDEQRALVSDYADNHNLPEWLAIKVFLYLSDNKWDDAAIISHLSSV